MSFRQEYELRRTEVGRFFMDKRKNNESLLGGSKSRKTFVEISFYNKFSFIKIEIVLRLNFRSIFTGLVLVGDTIRLTI